jgi:uncharacterized membrane protein HdeD (DUF308 family)
MHKKPSSRRSLPAIWLAATTGFLMILFGCYRLLVRLGSSPSELWPGFFVGAVLTVIFSVVLYGASRPVKTNSRYQ